MSDEVDAIILRASSYVNEILRDLRRYFEEKSTRFGPTPRGVDWKDSKSQETRFDQLSKIFPAHSHPVRLNDLGCGYAALFDFLKSHLKGSLSYYGYDISLKMTDLARRLHLGDKGFHIKHISHPREMKLSDYTLASGIFNNKLTHPVAQWKSYIVETLDCMARASRRGLAFNVLSLNSDPKFRRPDLYYADPIEMFESCRKRYSRNIALLHDYGLYEFTILIRL